MARLHGGQQRSQRARHVQQRGRAGRADAWREAVQQNRYPPVLHIRERWRSGHPQRKTVYRV